MGFKRVLLISYLFPPCGESGVQRNLKYTKYLLRFGYQPFILTTKDIAYHAYDYSILSEIPRQAQVIRTESFDPHRIGSFLRPKNPLITNDVLVRNEQISKHPGLLNLYRKLRNWLIFPDANIGWIPFAFKKGVDAIKRNQIDIIVGSVGPYSSAILSKMLSKKTRLPYVLDFRDGWTDDPYLCRPTRLHHWAHARLEKSIVSEANGVSVYGDFLYQQFARRYPGVRERLEIITNGFDPEDCDNIKPAPKEPGKKRIVFCGSVYEYLSPQFDQILAALKMLPADILANLELVFVGRCELNDAGEKIKAAGLTGHVTFKGYLPHREALAYLLSADASLLLLPKGDIQSYSGKIFEYFMVKKPVIACIEPEGTAATLLRQNDQGDWIVPPANAKSLCAAIARISICGWPEPRTEQIEQFSRIKLTEKLAFFLTKIIEDYRA